MSTKKTKKTKKTRKKIENTYTTVEQINNRLDVMIRQDLIRDFTTNEAIEFLELKRLRGKIETKKNQ